ncbi:MAG: hypothetical protein JJ979_19970 [Roseibium sp.]|nr:hypothetical protein [Roseibium sp.]
MNTLIDALAAWDRDGERPILVEIPPVDLVDDTVRDRQLLVCFLYIQSFQPSLRLPSLLDEPIQIHEQLFREISSQAAHGLRKDVSEYDLMAWSKMIAVLKKWREELALAQAQRLRLAS